MNDPLHFCRFGGVNQSLRVVYRAFVADAAIGEPHPIGVVKDARASHRFSQLFSVIKVKRRDLNSSKER
jgi:hypothetical protein